VSSSDAYYNHLFGQAARDNCCWPSTQRFCAEGQRLRRAYFVAWHTEHVMAGSTRAARRARLEEAPEWVRDEVRAGVEAAWEENRLEKQSRTG